MLLRRRGPARPLGRAPDGHAALHAGPARRVPRGRRRPVPERLRRGGDAEPLRRLQRPRPARCDARPRDAPGRRRSRHGPLLARVTPDGLLRVAADPAKDQTYMLAALAPESVRPHALPARRADQAGSAGAGLRGRASGRELAPESQDLCFLAGTGKARFPAAARSAERRAGGDRLLGRRGPRRAATASSTSPSASARGWASRAVEPLYVLRTEAGVRIASSSARGPSWRSDRVAVRVPACTVRGSRSTPSGCATTPAQSPCRVAGSPAAGTHRELELELAEPFYGAAPGQSACLLRGDVIVGWATIVTR